jgi:hypothetical protein
MKMLYISMSYLLGLFLIIVGFINILIPSYLIENNNVIFIIYRWEAAIIFIIGIFIITYATILWQKDYKLHQKK